MALHDPASAASLAVFLRAHDALRFPVDITVGVLVVEMSGSYCVTLVDFAAGDERHLRSLSFTLAVARQQLETHIDSLRGSVGFGDRIVMLHEPFQREIFSMRCVLVHYDTLQPRLVEGREIESLYNTI